MKATNNFNSEDQKRWDEIFGSPNPAWKAAPEQPFMRDALDFLKEHGARTVLDVGCGVGIWSIYLAKNGLEVRGTDFSPNAVEICRDWAAELGLGAVFETAPITFDAFPALTFDGAIATMILDNVASDEMEEAIRLLRSKLNPGGVLFAMFNPFLTDEQKNAIVAATNNPTKGMTSVTYTDHELKQAFPGFELVKFKCYPVGGLEFRALYLKRLD